MVDLITQSKKSEMLFIRDQNFLSGRSSGAFAKGFRELIDESFGEANYLDLLCAYCGF